MARYGEPGHMCKLATRSEGKRRLARQVEQFLDPFAGHFLDHCKRPNRAMDRALSLLLNDRCPMPCDRIHDHLANFQFDRITSAKLAVDR
jgi:hypothetical protein